MKTLIAIAVIAIAATVARAYAPSETFKAGSTDVWAFEDRPAHVKCYVIESKVALIGKGNYGPAISCVALPRPQ